MEEWKSCEKFPDYEFSNLGKIRNKNTLVHITHNSGEEGYVRITITNYQACRCSILVHRLVATCWIPNPEKKPTVNHKNSVRNDNRIENLEWSTDQEQTDHRMANGRKTNSFRNKIWKLDPKTSEKICLYDNALTAALDVGGNESKIRSVASGSRNTSAKYKWTYDGWEFIEGEKWVIFHTEANYVYECSNAGRFRNHK